MATVEARATANVTDPSAGGPVGDSVDTVDTLKLAGTTETREPAEPAEPAGTTDSGELTESTHTSDLAGTRHPGDLVETRHSENLAETRHSEDLAETRHPRVLAGTRHPGDLEKTAYSDDLAQTTQPGQPVEGRAGRTSNGEPATSSSRSIQGLGNGNPLADGAEGAGGADDADGAGGADGAEGAGGAGGTGVGSAAAGYSLVTRLRGNGLKLTPQRHLICRLIEQSTGHPTAEELYDRATEVMPSMSLKTVYTTLNELAGLGAIRLVNVGTGGFRVESNLEPHGHLVCRGCGKVIDVPVDPTIEAELSVPEEFDFEVEQRELTFRGLCGDCASKVREGEKQ